MYIYTHKDNSGDYKQPTVYYPWPSGSVAAEASGSGSHCQVASGGCRAAPGLMWHRGGLRCLILGGAGDSVSSYISRSPRGLYVSYDPTEAPVTNYLLALLPPQVGLPTAPLQLQDILTRVLRPLRADMWGQCSHEMCQVSSWNSGACTPYKSWPCPVLRRIFGALCVGYLSRNSVTAHLRHWSCK